MIRIAVPNKGSLADSAIAILKEAGYRQRVDARDLVLLDPENGVEFYYLRPRDIAIYVGSGELEAGITGRDLLIDSGAPANEILSLGFGGSTFRFAGSSDRDWMISDLAGKRIATAYPKLVENFLKTSGIDALIVPLDGAVESAIKLGVADVIADVVSTGSTLKQAGLEVFGEPLISSEAILIERSGATRDTKIETLVRRINSVVIARQYVLVDYDVPRAFLNEACALTPGLESPTISPLQKADWVAVRAMVKRNQVHGVMDELWNIGARGILVTDIHSCRL